MVRFETSHGDFTVELFPKEAPVTVENFLRYVDEGIFDGTIFHRIVPGFVIQGGGLTPRLRQKKTRPPINNEANNGLKNERGTLSMARTNDINSATSQFFVNLADNDFLDHGPATTATRCSVASATAWTSSTRSRVSGPAGARATTMRRWRTW